MINKTFALFVIVLSGLCVWWWSRSAPWDKAQRAINRGEPGKAVEVLVQALESKSWSPEKEEAMRELLARGYWLNGAIESADQALRDLREKFPTNFQAAVGLGTLNIIQDRGAFGVEYLEEAKRLDPKDIRPYLILGRYFSDIRDYRKAELNLANGFVRFPNDERLILLDGDLLFNQGRYQEALAKYQPLIAASPVDRDIRIKIALSFLYSGELEKALEIFTALRPASGTDENIESYLAKILFLQGHRQESNGIPERLYREDNRRIGAGLDWAVSLALRGQTEEAEKLLTTIGESLLPLGGGGITPIVGVSFNDLERIQSYRALAKSQNILYLRSRYQLLAIAGRYAEAQQFLERAFNIDSGDFFTMFEMAELARLKNDPEKRLLWADMAVEKYKEHPAALLLRAKILIDLRRTPDAVIDAKQVSDSYPKLSYAQALLSKAWMIQKKPSGALSAAEKAVQLNPGEPEAQLALAMAQASLGHDAEADLAFRRALDIDPRFAEARHELGLWLKSKGRLKEAATQFKEAARLEPLVYKH
jgi:tetratricopeptide (TPR) repeat protein